MFLKNIKHLNKLYIDIIDYNRFVQTNILKQLHNLIHECEVIGCWKIFEGLLKSVFAILIMLSAS